MHCKKRCRKLKEIPCIGDFDNVLWAKSSRLFKKKCKLIDARIGRGLLSTFHADYRLLSFPIDLVYHSSSIKIISLKVLEHIGSDHLPIQCHFKITDDNEKSKSLELNLTERELSEVKSKIKEGKQRTSGRTNQ